MTDKADAEAICEAVSRPSMRFVPVKSEETQGRLMTHKAREFLARQQTQIVNAIRAHLGEFGIVLPTGIHHADRLIAACDRADLSVPARRALNLLADQLVGMQRKIDVLTADVRADAKSHEAARRLQTIPGIGPITASALVATLPDVSDFRSGRDLSAWLGLTPKPAPQLSHGSCQTNFAGAGLVGVISIGFRTTVNCFDRSVTAEEAHLAIAKSFATALKAPSTPEFAAEMGPDYEPIRHLALDSDFDGATLVPYGADAVPWYLEGILNIENDEGVRPFEGKAIERLAGENLYDLLPAALEVR